MMCRGITLICAAAIVAACGGKSDETPAAPAAERAPSQAAEGAKEEAGAPSREGARAAAEGERAEGEREQSLQALIALASTNAPNAKVEIIEVSDFQCPFCSRVLPTLAEVKKRYGDDVKVTFLHNALSFHKDARLAAIAAVAASRQGKFWDYHDALFANQRSLKRADLLRYADELGLNAQQFERDLDDPALASFVDQNQAIAVALGATGTPAFFINGKHLRGAQPLEQFVALIDAELAEAERADRSGPAWIEARTRATNQPLHDYLYAGKAPPKTPPRLERPIDKTVYRVAIDPKRDAMRGGEDALVTLVVFSEFQCQFCGKLEPTLDALVAEYGEQLRVVFKHNPLPFHKRALPAATAALCAKDQGEFWAMHDRLFDNQRKLDDDDLARYAEELGLDMAEFEACVASGKHAPQVAADQELATRVNARGTPNVFINGRKLTGVKPLEEYKAIVDEELEKAEAVAARGLKGFALYEDIIKGGKVFEALAEKQNTFAIEDSPMKGDPKARIQLVAFSDFQCPFCSRINKPLDDVARHYGPDAVVVFKHFPLTFHRASMPASLASMCAHEQGKFWEYHDVLFANQRALSAEDLKGYAQTLGLDEEAFTACFESGRYKAKIEADMAEARAAGVRGTPVVFINGRKFSAPRGYSLKEFTAAIDKHVLAEP